jgi:hypothetical protein
MYAIGKITHEKDASQKYTVIKILHGNEFERYMCETNTLPHFYPSDYAIFEFTPADQFCKFIGSQIAF